MYNEVIWSPESEADLTNIFNFLLLKWNLRVAFNFLDDVENKIEKIIKNPIHYQIIHSELTIRRCVVTKHNSIIYFQKNDVIYILRLFDNRQDPEKLKF